MSRDGTVHESEGLIVLRYERRIAHPVEDVWRAITDPEELGGWHWQAEIDLVPGGRYVSHHGSGEEETVVEDRVLRVEPPTLFEHTFWVETAPRSVVRWELTPVDGGTELVLTHSFGPDEVPNRALNAAGWHHILDTLAERLDDGEAATSPEAVHELEPRYRHLDSGT